MCDTSFFIHSAVVTYLPKSKADKKKSLLGNAEDSKDESDVPKVYILLYVLFLLPKLFLPSGLPLTLGYLLCLC